MDDERNANTGGSAGVATQPRSTGGMTEVATDTVTARKLPRACNPASGPRTTRCRARSAVRQVKPGEHAFPRTPVPGSALDRPGALHPPACPGKAGSLARPRTVSSEPATVQSPHLRTAVAPRRVSSSCSERGFRCAGLLLITRSGVRQHDSRKQRDGGPRRRRGARARRRKGPGAGETATCGAQRSERITPRAATRESTSATSVSTSLPASVR